jgi:hypothetical protein
LKRMEKEKSADGPLFVVSCQWSVVSGQWSVVSGQCLKFAVGVFFRQEQLTTDN